MLVVSWEYFTDELIPAHIGTKGYYLIDIRDQQKPVDAKTVLTRIISYCILSYRMILFRIISYHFISCQIMSSHVMPYDHQHLHAPHPPFPHQISICTRRMLFEIFKPPSINCFLLSGKGSFLKRTLSRDFSVWTTLEESEHTSPSPGFSKFFLGGPFVSMCIDLLEIE